MGFKGRRGGGECGFGKGQVIGEKCSTVIKTEKSAHKSYGKQFCGYFMQQNCTSCMTHHLSAIILNVQTNEVNRRQTMNIHNFISISSVQTQQKQRQHFWTKGQTQKNRDWSKRAASVHAQITSESFKCGIACTQSAHVSMFIQC